MYQTSYCVRFLCLMTVDNLMILFVNCCFNCTNAIDLWIWLALTESVNLMGYLKQHGEV